MEKFQINFRKTLMVSVLMAPLFIMHSCDKSWGWKWRRADHHCNLYFATHEYSHTNRCLHLQRFGWRRWKCSNLCNIRAFTSKYYVWWHHHLVEWINGPVEDITIEVEEESTDHQFFFAPSSAITITYNDVDANGNPLGIKTTPKTGPAASNQSIKVTLRHEPNKSASGVKEGNIANAGGETDIEITYTLNVQ